MSNFESSWAVRTMDQFIEQYPLFKDHPYLNDRWHYENGCILKAAAGVYELTGDDKYVRYIQNNMDQYVQLDGSIRTYSLEEYNLDQINQGKLLLFLYQKTNEAKYLQAAHLLAMQLKGHPRTSDGGFWHKKIYPFQMWLDGLYMASPFMAEYGAITGQDEWFDEAVHQLLTVEKHTRNPKTGLLHHGWDESREQRWADAETGCSQHVWGRAVGWYCMAVVDVLEHLPRDHRLRGQVIGIYERMYDALSRIQDNETGLWCQVMGEEGREGNYFEATGSAMIVYSAAKALNKGYLSRGYRHSVKKGYKGIIDYLVEVDDKGRIHLHKNNKGAGLGGNPYRDGTYEYYINERVVSNDPKGVSPFILASVEFERRERF